MMIYTAKFGRTHLCAISVQVGHTWEVIKNVLYLANIARYLTIRKKYVKSAQIISFLLKINAWSFEVRKV